MNETTHLKGFNLATLFNMSDYEFDTFKENNDFNEQEQNTLQSIEERRSVHLHNI